MPCAICGRADTEDAHVRANGSFEDGEDDRTWNIVTLCPSCHTAFDNGTVGITRDKNSFVIQDEEGSIKVIHSKVSLAHIRDDYLEWKIQRCSLKVRVKLGIVTGYEGYAFTAAGSMESAG